jgi:hypothetical protein
MKFLLYSSTEVPDASSTGIANALERLGHGVSRWQRPRVGITPNPRFPLEEIISVARLYKIDCFVFFGGSEISKPHISALRTVFPQSAFIMWNFDVMTVPDTWDWFEPLARECDLAIQMDTSKPEMWEGINKKYLRMGIDSAVEKPYLGEITQADRDKYEADVAFMGMGYEMGGRKRTLELVKAWCAKNGKTFKMWGLWTEYLIGEDLAKMIALTKIHLGHEPENRPADHWSQRVYTILAHRGFYLTKYVPGYEKQFAENSDLCFWRDEGDLLNKLDAYTGPWDSLRRVVATRGMMTVRNGCTWDLRVGEALPWIEDVLRSKRS